jgi:hypothetical protein
VDEQSVRIANEFAAVRVGVDRSGNGPRLRIEDLSSGVAISLDALELQSLAWSTHRDLAAFAAPEFRERAFERLLGQVLSTMAVDEAQAIISRIEAAD